VNKTKIEWCDSTWNPVTGCLHGCEYCYARRIAERFGGTIQQADFKEKLHEINEPMYTENNMEKITKAPYPFCFAPTLHRYRLEDYKRNAKPKTIFVCSMADLFGEWVPDEWIKEVFRACEAAPQHRYLFLTKNPKRYIQLESKGILLKNENMWYGSTVTSTEDEYYAAGITHNIFLSIEPLLKPLKVGVGSFSSTSWIIIGAETGNRKDKIIPKKEWISEILEASEITHIPIFMKESLLPIVGEENMRREFPWDIKNDYRKENGD